MATDETVKAPATADQPEPGVRVYRLNQRNRMTIWILSVGLFFVAGRTAWLAHHGRPLTREKLIGLSVFFGLVLFAMFRAYRIRLILRTSDVEVVGPFGSRTIPFNEIAGRRNDGWLYLCLRDKSRVYVRQSMLQLDDFYRRWRDSIYDLDMADRMKRRGTEKERKTDWFAVNDHEQHPAIGGPERVG